MQIRTAQVTDAQAICELVNYYAERGLMLHRSLESVYDSLREFRVAQDADGQIIGCVAVDVFWADLAEIKSLAVAGDSRGASVGQKLIRAAIEDATSLGIRRLFALTYETAFFEKCGFSIITRDCLPEKVWRECITCPKADVCDEVAMVLYLGEAKR